MDYRNIIQWVLELDLNNEHIRFITQLSLIADKYYVIECGSHSPKDFILNNKLLNCTNEIELANLLKGFDESNIVAVESVHEGSDKNRLTLLI